MFFEFFINTNFIGFLETKNFGLIFDIAKSYGIEVK